MKSTPEISIINSTKDAFFDLSCKIFPFISQFKTVSDHSNLIAMG
jgi:hypothetical protein